MLASVSAGCDFVTDDCKWLYFSSFDSLTDGKLDFKWI